MNTSVLDAYIKRAQQLSCRLEHEPGALQELLHSIEQSKDSIGQNLPLEEFFKGEYAFYNANYERALKHYLEATTVDKFEFFCYRASAFVCKTQGDFNKAVGFAKRALDIHSDYTTLNLLKELLSSLGHQQEAKEIQAKARAFIEQFNIKTEAFNPTFEAQGSRRSIGQKEIQELAGIFLASSSDDGLFESEVELSEHKEEQVCSLFNDKEQNFKKNIPESFNELKAFLINDYLSQWQQRPPLPCQGLYVLNGWKKHVKVHNNSFKHGDFETALSLLTDDALKASGGFYIRWNGKGIVLNPGKHFLKYFHRQGLHIRDIDFVICASDDPDSYCDVKKIYDLSFKLNSVSNDFRIIHYYIQESAFTYLSKILRPHFKEERNAVHRLEEFEAVSEMEKVEFDADISLHYKSLQRSQQHSHFFHYDPSLQGSALCLKLELSNGHLSKKSLLTVGYVQNKIPPSKCMHIGPCDILLTDLFDQSKEISHLVNTIGASLLLCVEYDGLEGDHRLEKVKKLREHLGKGHSPIVLPVDNGFFLDLQSFAVKSSFNNHFIPVKDVHVVRSEGDFSQLVYLASSSIL